MIKIMIVPVGNISAPYHGSFGYETSSLIVKKSITYFPVLWKKCPQTVVFCPYKKPFRNSVSKGLSRFPTFLFYNQKIYCFKSAMLNFSFRTADFLCSY